MVAALDIGVVTYRESGKDKRLFVGGGFAEVRENTVRLVCDASERPDEIDPEEAATQFEQLARTTPDQAARWILGAMLKNKRRALIGPDAHVFDVAARVSPRGAQWLIGRLAGRARENNVAIV